MNKELIVEAIRDKMFTIMAEEKKKFSDTYFAEQMGLSKATLSRILNFKPTELDNLVKVCKWLKRPIDDFVN